jgi:hypothetical protein
VDCTTIREEFRTLSNRYVGPTKDFIAFCECYSDHLIFFEQAEKQLKSFIRSSSGNSSFTTNALTSICTLL